MSALLSKSKYMIGLQCPKYLWTVFHEPENMPEVSKSMQHRFDQGHLVGQLAKSLFKDGIDIPTEDFKENLKSSKELLIKRKPLFEPAFSVNNLYSRADILNPVGGLEWDIIEVKSSTEVKDEHIKDISFQKYTYEECGIKIRKCFLMCINNEYVKDGEIDPKKLFKIEDVTKEVNEEMDGIKERIEDMFSIIDSKNCPSVKIGKICRSPYECQLIDKCWSFLPDDNVFTLYRGGEKSEELLDNGVYSIKDIPDDFKLNDKQELQRECLKTGKPHIHKEAIKHFLSGLKEPLYYLDFETFQTAIPLYDKTGPYQQIPFQFSLHIEEKGKVSHKYFLATGKKDPREEFLVALKEVIGEAGTVVVYNQTFEISRLKELAEVYPLHKKWIDNVLSRIVDLLVPFRNFSYYHPSQNGSASIKKVMPVLTGRGYNELEINNGGDASLAFLDITFEKVSLSEQKKIRDNLEKYCGRDTEGMQWIVEELRKIVK